MTTPTPELGYRANETRLPSERAGGRFGVGLGSVTTWLAFEQYLVGAPVHREAPIFRGSRCRVTTREPQGRPEDDRLARRARWAGRLPFPPERTFT